MPESVGDYVRERTSAPDQEPVGGDPLAAIAERGRWSDLAVLATVPVVLLLIYALPLTLRTEYALQFHDPSLVTAYTNHFVHLTPPHLLANLIGYVVVVSSAYLLAVAAGWRHQFFVVFVGFNLSVPFALSATNLVWQWPGFSVGYSGVLMAFVGYLPVVLLEFLGKGLSLPVDGRHSVWLFLIFVSIAAYITLPAVYSVPLVIVTLLYLVAFTGWASRRVDRETLPGIKARIGVPGNVELALFGVVVVLAYPFVAFSGNLVHPSGTLNVYTHGVGFATGYVVVRVGLLTGWLDLD